jgi:hypothetical protein
VSTQRTSTALSAIEALATERWDLPMTSTARAADVILAQLGAHKFFAMTGASHLVAGERALHTRLPRNASGANQLTIILEYGESLEHIRRVLNDGKKPTLSHDAMRALSTSQDGAGA